MQHHHIWMVENPLLLTLSKQESMLICEHFLLRPGMLWLLNVGVDVLNPNPVLPSVLVVANAVSTLSKFVHATFSSVLSMSPVCLAVPETLLLLVTV